MNREDTNRYGPEIEISGSLGYSNGLGINTSYKKILLTVYNILGEPVQTLADRIFTVGSHRIIWRPEGLPAGIYLLRLKSGRFEAVKKPIY